MLYFIWWCYQMCLVLWCHKWITNIYIEEKFDKVGKLNLLSNFHRKSPHGPLESSSHTDPVLGLNILFYPTALAEDFQIYKLSSPSPKSDPLRPNPTPKAVPIPNSSPIGTGVTQPAGFQIVNLMCLMSGSIHASCYKFLDLIKNELG